MRFHITLTGAALLILPGIAWTQPTECESVNLRVKGVSRNSPATATVDFVGSGGQLDPAPLLETQIALFARTCVIVHFSAQADPLDNHIVFQASIDNVPMSGHAQFPYSTPPPPTPVVWDPEETDKNLSRMVAYTFVAFANPGTHTVRIRWAACCSVTPSTAALVRNAVMSVHF